MISETDLITTKDSFLRELRKVAPEMKNILWQSYSTHKVFSSPFYKIICILKICQESDSPHFFDGNSLPNTTITESYYSNFLFIGTTVWNALKKSDFSPKDDFVGERSYESIYKFRFFPSTFNQLNTDPARSRTFKHQPQGLLLHSS